MHGGYTVHVNSKDRYLALYSHRDHARDRHCSTQLNHVGLLVEDLDQALETVRAQGHEPYHLSDYEPSRRFYFRDGDNIEFEVVSYE